MGNYIEELSQSPCRGAFFVYNSKHTNQGTKMITKSKTTAQRNKARSRAKFKREIVRALADNMGRLMFGLFGCLVSAGLVAVKMCSI